MCLCIVGYNVNSYCELAIYTGGFYLHFNRSSSIHYQTMTLKMTLIFFPSTETTTAHQDTHHSLKDWFLYQSTDILEIQLFIAIIGFSMKNVLK